MLGLCIQRSNHIGALLLVLVYSWVVDLFVASRKIFPERRYVFQEYSSRDNEKLTDLMRDHLGTLIYPELTGGFIQHVTDDIIMIKALVLSNLSTARKK